MSGALRELAVIFGIEAPTKDLDEADKKISNLIGRVKEYGKAVLEGFAADAVREFVQSQVEAATGLERTAQTLGLTTEQVETFSFAAGAAGVRADAMTTALQYLNFTMAEAIRTGGVQAQIFNDNGIRLKDMAGHTKSVNDVMAELADKIAQTTDASKKMEIARELMGRGGAELLPILSKGSAAFRDAAQEMRELGGPTSKEVIEGAKKVEESEARLDFAWTSVKQTLSLKLFPVFDQLVKWGTQVSKTLIDLATHTKILDEALGIFAAVGTYKAGKAALELASKLKLLKPSVVETAVAFADFAVPIAIVAVLFLVFDSLFVLLSGGKSAIGDLLDKFGGINTSTKSVLLLNAALSDTLRILRDLKNAVGGAFSSIGKAFMEQDDPGDHTGLSAFRKGWRDLTAGGNEMNNAGADMMAPTAFENMRALLNAGVDPKDLLRGAHAFDVGIVGALGGGGVAAKTHPAPGHKVDLSMAALLRAFGHTQPPTHGHVRHGSGLPPVHGGASGTVNMHQENHITVHTGSNQPRAVGEAVGQGVATPTERAASNALRATQRT